MNRGSVKGELLSELKRKQISTNEGYLSILLSHSYATHLLEAGVNIRVIQRYMGHRMLETTMKYLHLTKKGQEDAYQIINTVMSGFSNDRS